MFPFPAIAGRKHAVADASTHGSNELSVWVEGLVHPHVRCGPGDREPEEAFQYVDLPAGGLLPFNKINLTDTERTLSHGFGRITISTTMTPMNNSAKRSDEYRDQTHQGGKASELQALAFLLSRSADIVIAL
jgi:hypothetical protein